MIYVECVEGKTKVTGEALQLALADERELRGILNWTGKPLRDMIVPVLNANAFSDKLRQLNVLKEKGIPVPRFELPLRMAPSSPHPGWLPRKRFHSACSDFLLMNGLPDYFMEPLDIVEEWRAHVGKTKRENMRILRSSKRVALEGAHPWIHSFDLGWRWRFEEIGDEQKKLARDTCRALDLDLAAVDLVRILTEDDIPEWLVLEVNTCPGLADEPETLRRYVDFIKERFS